MRIVQVMPQYPFPMTDGGKVGLGSIALELVAQGHTVVVVCYAPAGTAAVHSDGLDVRMVPHSTTNTPLRIAASLVRRRALYMSKHDTAAMEHAIAQAIADINADVVVADHTCMAPMVQRAAQSARRPWALRLHNVEWMIWHRYAERYPWRHPARWYVQGQAARLRREEALILGQASVVFAITSTDAERALAMQPQARIVVAPAGVHAEQWKRLRIPATPPQVIMASNYRWVHNADALRWFVENVWPEVHRQTGSTLHVVGTDVPQWLSDMAVKGAVKSAVNSIVAEGFVPNLAERYRTASVSIAPLFVGSGMRIKILEAMAAGLPVVSTSVGAEGIELFEDDGLFRTDDVRTMTSKLVELLKDPDLCARWGASAQQRVGETYSWTAAVGGMVDVLSQCPQLCNELDNQASISSVDNQ